MSQLNLTILLSILALGTVSGVQDKYPVPFSKLATCREFDIHDNKCQHYFPFSTFKNYKSDKYRMRLKLYVMTNTDANIAFTNGKDGAEHLDYTIVVGAGANTRSGIRRNGIDSGVESHKIGILSFLWPTPILVTLTHCGILEVSIPDVIEPLLRAYARDMDYSLVCFYTWNAESRWFYNCDEEEDINLNQTETCGNPYGDSSLDLIYEYNC